jgi:hypothetical protein
MAAAYLVKYRGPTGDCPDCVVIFDSPGECVAEFAQRIQDTLVKARGGHWQPHDVRLYGVTYLGPWFSGESHRSRAAALAEQERRG